MEKILKYVNHHFGSDAKVIKTDLAAQDLRENAEKINSVVLNMGFFNELQRVENKMSTAIRDAMDLEKTVSKNLEEFVKAIKDLGMNPNEFTNYKFATRELSLLKSNIKDAQKRLQALERAMGS